MHLEWRLVIQILKMENEPGLHLFCLITSLFRSGTGPGLVVHLSTPSSLCMVLELPGHCPLWRIQGAALAAAPRQQWGWGCACPIPALPSGASSPDHARSRTPSHHHATGSPLRRAATASAYFKHLGLNKHKESLLLPSAGWIWWHGKKKNQAANWKLVKWSRDRFLLDVDTGSWDEPRMPGAPPLPLTRWQTLVTAAAIQASDNISGSHPER